MNTASTTRTERRSRKRPLIAAVLAVVAVGGIGAAATSAAWTDNVFFTAPAQAATFDLQGSLDGTSWVQSDNANSVQLVVPAATFANLLPGQSRTVTLYVENTGTANSALTANAAWSSGSTFTTNPTISVTPASSTLAAANGSTPTSTTVTLTVSAPTDWSTANQGKSGNVIVTVAGTATA